MKTILLCLSILSFGLVAKAQTSESPLSASNSVTPEDQLVTASRAAYPSSVSDVLTIPVDQNENVPSVIAVVDLQGKVVGEYVPRRESENEIRIYPANLSPGVYHIKDFRKFRREKKVISFSKL
jgi:hypothetical protein